MQQQIKEVMVLTMIKSFVLMSSAANKPHPATVDLASSTFFATPRESPKFLQSFLLASSEFSSSKQHLQNSRLHSWFNPKQSHCIVLHSPLHWQPENWKFNGQHLIEGEKEHLTVVTISAWILWALTIFLASVVASVARAMSSIACFFRMMAWRVIHSEFSFWLDIL